MTHKDLFARTTQYYSRYRPEYPEEIFRILSEHIPLTDKVLDLGCGTGFLALPLARKGFTVYAVDPNPEMLEEGRIQAENAGVTGVVWLSGDDRSLPELQLPALCLCIMGNCFHWMRADTLLRTLDTLITPEGKVAILDRGTGVWSDPTGWRGVVREVITEFLGPERRAGSGFFRSGSEEYSSVLLRSPFYMVKSYSIPMTTDFTVDQVVGLQLSTSYASPALLGERCDEFREVLTARLLDYNPSGVFRDERAVRMLLAGRSYTGV